MPETMGSSGLVTRCGADREAHRVFEEGCALGGGGWAVPGMAGQVKNCQIETFLAYRSRLGHALVERELYLPQAWTADRDRCRAAGIAEEVEFASKPQQAIAC